jgi:hypothetical protein
MSDTTSNIMKHLPILKKLANKKDQVYLIKNADEALMTALCDIVHNILNGHINISDRERRRLSKYKTQLRHLCKHSTLEHKKRYLKQKGGFLQVLIPSAIAGISSIIASYVGRQAREE